ncbi:MAG: chorismate mutase [Polyangiaceae bacterium]
MSLVALRDRIEALDRQIITLIAERLKIVSGVIEAKLATASPFRDREREESLIGRLRAVAVEVGVDPHQIERMYRVVMDMSVAHQEQAVRDRSDVPLRVSYQGVEGSSSHLAAQGRYAGREGGALLTSHDSFRAAFTAVLDGAADLALLPIENTAAGGINETYDLLAAGGLHITGEMVYAIPNGAIRFVEVAPRPAPIAEGTPAKTSLVLSLADRPGALGEVLMRFAARGISLTKIESRPIPDAPFTYRFYVDVLGHSASSAFVATLDELRSLTTELRVLGTYPAAAQP